MSSDTPYSILPMIGQRVRAINGSPVAGTIIALGENGQLQVRWDNGVEQNCRWESLNPIPDDDIIQQAERYIDACIALTKSKVTEIERMDAVKLIADHTRTMLKVFNANLKKNQ